MAKKIAIVGAGVGGLAAAARLAYSGHDVDVFEKLPECGGRAHQIEYAGYKFDTGPSFVLMPGFFAEIFSSCGTEINEHIELKQLDVHYKIFYPDGDTLTVHKDMERTKSELERFEEGSAKGFESFIKDTEKIYGAVEPLLYKSFKPSDAFNPNYWPLVFKLRIWDTYWKLAKRHFKSDKLCYALTFEAMFIGVSPFKTPAFYSIITYADHVQKIAHPLGGMYMIPKALEGLAKGFGAKFHYSKEVQKVSGRDDGTILKFSEGEERFDNTIINADWAYSQTDLLERRLGNIKSSCSVFLIYLGLNKKVPGLEHHNLFFAKDLEKNLEQIFDVKNMPQDFSFYVHVPTVTDPSLAPDGGEILYILIPVPNLQGIKDDMLKYEDSMRKTVLDKIRQVTGVDVEPLIITEHKFYPKDFITRYNIKYGATFGLAHTLMQSAFFRPGNQDRKIKGLYYVGASTQPGGGLPPVIASSRIVADMITSEDGPAS